MSIKNNSGTTSNMDQYLESLQGAGDTFNNIYASLETPDIQGPSIQLTSKNDLMSQWGNQANISLGRNNTLKNSISSGISGATAGIAGGPRGAVVGGVVGLIGGLVGSIFGNKARRRKENRLNTEMWRNYQSSADSLNSMENNLLESNFYSEGGKIYIKPSNRGKFTESAKRAKMGVQEYARHILSNKDKYSPTMVKRANFARNASKWHAFGGNLKLGNGVTIFQNGGTHESNPNMGIPQGQNQNGVPNLVEEGEVKYNNYIYSNRLKPDKNILIKSNLKDSYFGKTYADIAKKLQKESEERPNDPISKKGLKVNMSRLELAQEVSKLGSKNNKNLFWDGGDLGKQMYNSFIDSIQNEEDYNEPEYTFNLDQVTNTTGLSNSIPRQNVLTAPEKKLSKSQKLASYLRYIPALGGAVGVLTDSLGLTNKPDYRVANELSNIHYDYNPIGNYLTYTPFDRDYYINYLNANSGATRRALQNSSGGNRATYAANVLAADYNYGNQLGQLARQAEEYNLQQRQQVENFNRGTNMFNTELDFKTQQMNNYNLTQIAQLKDNARKAAAQARSINLTNLFNSLGDIGREQVARNMIYTNPRSPYFINSIGDIIYKGE